MISHSSLCFHRFRLASHSSHRRQSLVQEIEGRDPNYANARINDVLNTLPPDDRHVVLTDYNKQSSQVKDKTFFLANLIDALFDRKQKSVSVLEAVPDRTFL
jgi:hypothetical protein